MPIYSERAAGIYRCTYTGWREMTFDQDDGSKSVRWLFTFRDAEGKDLSKFTGTDPRSANSNAYKMMAGILGHKPAPGDDTELHVGQPYDVVYGLNQAGNLTVTSVVRVADAPAAVPTQVSTAATQVFPVTPTPIGSVLQEATISGPMHEGMGDDDPRNVIGELP